MLLFTYYLLKLFQFVRMVELANGKVELELVFQVVSIISAVCSLSVLFTGLIFSSMRRRIFMRIICFISLADFVSSIASAWGFPQDHTITCTAQSFLISCFMKATWFWTTMLVYQMYCVVLYQKISSLGYYHMHCLVWGASLFIALFPLVTARFGRQGPDADVEFCFISDSNVYLYLFWNFFDWILVLVGCLGVMAYCTIKIYFKFLATGEMTALKSRNFLIFKTLYMYPIILIVTWIPMVCGNVIVFFDNSLSTDLVIVFLSIVSILTMFNGIFLAVVFFLKSGESRARWRNLLCYPTFKLTSDSSTLSLEIPIDFEEAEDYEHLEQVEGDSRIASTNSVLNAFSLPFFRENSYLSNTIRSGGRGGGRIESLDVNRPKIYPAETVSSPFTNL